MIVCVCNALMENQVREAARDGGCIALEHVDAPALTAAISRLLTTPTELAGLAGAAQARTFRTWRDYARDVATWLPTLSRRP